MADRNKVLITKNLNGFHKSQESGERVVTNQPNGSAKYVMSTLSLSEQDLIALGLRPNSFHKEGYLFRLWSFCWETCWGHSGPDVFTDGYIENTNYGDDDEIDITLAVISQMVGNNPDEEDSDDYCDNGSPDESYGVGMDVDHFMNSTFDN